MRPVPSAGPHAIVGTSAAPAFDTLALNEMSYGWSGKNENCFVTERPPASRYSKLRVPVVLVAFNESVLGLNNALSSTALTAGSSVVSANGLLRPAGTLCGTRSRGWPFSLYRLRRQLVITAPRVENVACTASFSTTISRSADSPTRDWDSGTCAGGG
jgi:hypothetical protein